MTTPNIAPVRGEVWEINFDPGEGDEIKKTRPAVVMSVATAGRMRLRLVVPIMGWQPQFARYYWMTFLTPTAANGLTKESAADAVQIKSLSLNRFQRKIGVLTADEID